MKLNWQPVIRKLAGLLSLMVAVFMLSSGAIAQETPTEQAATEHGAAEKGGKCIRETPYMRRNHMDLILHKRDRTMYKGVRTKDASLTQCVSCHAKKDEKTGEFLKASDPKHFCRGCHDYTAVTIDCFGCHASRPTDGKKTESSKASGQSKNLAATHGMPASTEASVAALSKYLGGTK